MYPPPKKKVVGGGRGQKNPFSSFTFFPLGKFVRLPSPRYPFSLNSPYRVSFQSVFDIYEKKKGDFNNIFL